MIFFDGIRVSTWLTALVFVAVYMARRDSRVLVAAFAWIAGFEFAYQVTTLATGHPLPAWHWGPFALMAVGVLALIAAGRAGIWPSPWLMGLVAVLWIAWLAIGFNSNSATGPLDPLNEALNEAAKTAWALAYLWPFLAQATWNPRIRVVALGWVTRGRVVGSRPRNSLEAHGQTATAFR